MTGPVVVVSGSTRRDSLNQHLARLAAASLAARGREAEYLDLDRYPMPLYHGDVEAEHGAPESAERLHARITAADGLLVASPEYNGTMPPLLKNTVDWLTRVERGVLRGRTVGLMGASPGSRGAAHALGMIRTWFEYLGLDVLDEQFSLPKAREALEIVDGSARLGTEDAARLDAFLDRYIAALDTRNGGV